MKEISQTLKGLPITEKIETLQRARDLTYGAHWQRGISSHHVATLDGYHIAEFHHAVDAEFSTMAHALVPELTAHLTALLTANEMRAHADKENQKLKGQLFMLAQEVKQLRAFAQGVMQSWPIGDVDGGHLQDLAVEHGLLVETTQAKPCREEGCTCAEYLASDEFPTECYRYTNLLKGN